MNDDMKKAWLEISQMLGEPTREELDVFLRTWQRAIQAEREACAAECERMVMYPNARQESAAHQDVWAAAKAIRARGQA